MPACPVCRRPVALARPTCLYCGAGLEAAAAPAAAVTPAALARALLLLDLADAHTDRLEQAAGLPRYEAERLVRRGGVHLLRALPAEEAEPLAAALAAQGLRAVAVPEDEVRAEPLCVRAAELQHGRLALRTTAGPGELRRGDLLLVVAGPIAREYRPALERRKVDTARLEQGFRVHLHRRHGPPPLELDPANLELGFAPSGSARLEIEAWLSELAGDVPRDDTFRLHSPALALERPAAAGPLAAAASLRRGPVEDTPDATLRAVARGSEPLALDNLGQFRLYSGCRGALERRREAPGR